MQDSVFMSSLNSRNDMFENTLIFDGASGQIQVANAKTKCLGWTPHRILLLPCTIKQDHLRSTLWDYWIDGTISLNWNHLGHNTKYLSFDARYMHNGNFLRLSTRAQAKRWSFDHTFHACDKGSGECQHMQLDFFYGQYTQSQYNFNILKLNQQLVTIDSVNTWDQQYAQFSMFAFNMYTFKLTFKKTFFPSDFDNVASMYDIDSIPGASIIVIAGINILESDTWVARRLLDLRGENNKSVLYEAKRTSTSSDKYTFVPNNMDYTNSFLFPYYDKLYQVFGDANSQQHAYFAIIFKPLLGVNNMGFNFQSPNTFSSLYVDTFVQDQTDKQTLTLYPYVAIERLKFKLPNKMVFLSGNHHYRQQVSSPNHNSKAVILTNPFDCSFPFIPGTLCVFECAWGYTTRCDDVAIDNNIHPFRTFFIRSPVGYDNAIWAKSSLWYTMPSRETMECCSVSEVCTGLNDISLWHTESNPSITDKLSITQSKTRLHVQSTFPSLPYDIDSEGFVVTCKYSDLEMITSGLTLAAPGYARYCSFNDVNSNLAKIGGSEPDCRGPATGQSDSIDQSNLNIPDSWTQGKITTINYCNEWDEIDNKYQTDSASLDDLKTVHLFARMTVRSTKYYDVQCQNVDFNTLFYQKPLKIEDHSKRDFPKWNEPMNDPQIYSFNLPPGMWVDHHQNVRGYPLGFSNQPYDAKFCAVNIATKKIHHQWNRPSTHCVDFKFKVTDPALEFLYYDTNTFAFQTANGLKKQISNHQTVDNFINDWKSFNKRHVIQSEQSFQLWPRLTPKYLLPQYYETDILKRCQYSDEPVITNIFLDETNTISSSDIKIAGNINQGFVKIDFTVRQNVAIMNHNKYFEILNPRWRATNHEQAKQFALDDCKLLCKLDQTCRSAVLWLNDVRRVPTTSREGLHGTIIDETFICDMFQVSITNDYNYIKYDITDTTNSWYIEKKVVYLPPLYLKYRTAPCKHVRNTAIRGLSTGFCQNGYLGETSTDQLSQCNCQCMDQGYEPLYTANTGHNNEKGWHYNIYSDIIDERFAHPYFDHANYCTNTPDDEETCIDVTRTCPCVKLATPQSVFDPPIQDIMIGTKSQCTNQKFYPQGININHDLIPNANGLPPLYVCVKYWNTLESYFTLSDNNNRDGLTNQDVKNFLDRIKLSYTICKIIIHTICALRTLYIYTCVYMRVRFLFFLYNE